MGERGILALVNPERLRRILTRMLDEHEFLSPYGIRSLSRFHAQHPYVFHVGPGLPGGLPAGRVGHRHVRRQFQLAGPIWIPVNALIIRALMNFYLYYGDGFKIECPTGSGRMMNLFEVAQEIAERLTRIFLRDSNGRRPVYGGTAKFPDRPALA